jgi:hypothetical protein
MAFGPYPSRTYGALLDTISSGHWYVVRGTPTWYVVLQYQYARGR